MKKLFALLIIGVSFIACQKSSVDKKEEDLIHYKQTVAINDVPSASLTFSEVEDSRCPEGVQCIWAGNADIDLVLEGFTTEGRVTRTAKMCFGTCSNFVADTLNYDFAGTSYRFILKAVTPAPKKDTELKKTDYGISLDIQKTKLL